FPIAPSQEVAVSLSAHKIPNYKYFPTHLMEGEGPRHWAQLRFLQACERLSIPQQLWPTFPGMKLPYEYHYNFGFADSFVAPAFSPLYESEQEWRKRAFQAFDEFIKKQAD